MNPQFCASRPPQQVASTGRAAHAEIPSGGNRLDAPTQARMSAQFGHDFSQVRIHTDAEAAGSARTLAARAYTLGSDIVFGAGRYVPGTPDGERLLAHELTHVVQQAKGGVGDMNRASRRSDASETEAEDLADRVVAGERVCVQAMPGAAIARDEDDDYGDTDRSRWNGFTDWTPAPAPYVDSGPSPGFSRWDTEPPNHALVRTSTPEAGGGGWTQGQGAGGAASSGLASDWGLGRPYMLSPDVGLPDLSSFGDLVKEAGLGQPFMRNIPGVNSPAEDGTRTLGRAVGNPPATSSPSLIPDLTGPGAGWTEASPRTPWKDTPLMSMFD